ncbi:MAG: hypothetical protein MJK04_29315 [Psychrosphaera sp.]|nr:hypothetical protein [Psychrosphaera sp.]
MKEKRSHHGVTEARRKKEEKTKRPKDKITQKQKTIAKRLKGVRLATCIENNDVFIFALLFLPPWLRASVVKLLTFMAAGQPSGSELSEAPRPAEERGTKRINRQGKAYPTTTVVS